jgi:hypothetical protein
MQLDLIVAILALVTAVLSAYATRVHNRLSVKPLLNISLDFSEGKVGLKVKNCGVGPAIIKTIQVRFQNELFDGSKMDWGVKIGNEYKAVLSKENKSELLTEMDKTFYSIYMPGDIITANESYYLYESMDNVTNNEVLALLYLLLLDVGLKITYTSIYNEKFIIDKSLKDNMDASLLINKWGMKIS